MILPIRDVLDILSGKWKLQILFVLIIYGKKRFNDLEREIPGITPKMLSKELKDLEINELVTRRVHDTAPITVEYEMTDYGNSLKPLINEMFTWGTSHRMRMIARR